MTTHVTLITTTINVPSTLVDVVAHTPADVDLTLVVAGDVQTPPETEKLVVELDGVYLGVVGEAVQRWRTNLRVGVRSIQRRNLALLHALTLGPDVIITVDDDNRPLDPATYVRTFITGLRDLKPTSNLTRSSTGWYNPAHVLDPPVTHRGYPLDQRHRRGTYVHRPHEVTMAGGPTPRGVGVVAGLWFGDPDVDALERLAVAPHVVGFRAGSGPRDVVLDVGTWAPFNTQNTAYRWEVAPLMQCLVGVGRYDDVWMSYVARRVMDELSWHVRYGYPPVEQRRNEHNLVLDLERELYGYRETPALVRRLRALTLDAPWNADPVDVLEQVYNGLYDVLEPPTCEANDAWLVDVRRAVEEGARRRAERGVDDVA